jgi:hypothetical protein
MPRGLVGIGVAIAGFIHVHSAEAQLLVGASTMRSRWTVDVAGQYAQPVGALRTNVRDAWGMTLAASYRVGWFDAIGLRADVGFLNYGNERKRVPLSPTLNRVVVDMTTSNNIFLATAGPMLAVPRGPIRPYAHVFAGYSYFYTESSVADADRSDSFASTTNFSDGGLAYGWGAGVTIPIAIRRAAVAVDLGARRTTNGQRQYLRRGDIQDQPDGSLLLNRRMTDANFWQFHAGASFAIRNR